jgi:DNA-directed RNA polymerase subunit RPC12/RpoP
LLLRVTCPHCQKPCQLDPEAVNGPIACPHCSHRFAVRRPPAAEQADGKANGTPAGTAAAEGVKELEPSLPPGKRPLPADPTAAWHAEEGGEQAKPVSLEGGPLGFIDRLLPSRPRAFLIVVGGIVVSCWLLALLLAADRAAFLATREWQAMPVYLAAHFITLRLFVTLYSGNFLRGCRFMTVPMTEAVHSMRYVLGPLGGLAGLVIAVPFTIKDMFDLFGKYNDSLGPASPVGSVWFLLWGTWCLEWIINAYIWVLQLGFLMLTLRTLRRYTFRDPVEIMLHEKHYRPFLLMSGQGASIVLGFGIITCLYIWYTGGEIQDYLGLIITGVLLLVGFGPPWLLLKSQVENAVNGEKYRLRDRIIAAARRRAAETAAPDGAAAAVTGLQELATRVDEALTMLRIDYLDRLQRELGQNEARNMLLRLLAPAGTILWKVLRPFLFGS